jgi:cytochrome c biogenesis protein CcmG/thiol:disulfide interchange protein DsbE
MEPMDDPSSSDDLTPEPATAPEAASPESAVSGDQEVRRMSPRTRAWIGMGAVLVALVLLMMLPGPGVDPDAPPPAADGTGAADEEHAVVGKPAQLQFTLKDMNGVNVDLSSFKGKVMLINFWATWCGPCRVEIPYLMELQTQYEGDLVVLGVSVDDTAEKLQPYAKEMKINYPLLVGNGRQDFQDAYGPFWGIPVTVFVGRDGTIHKKHSGIASKEQFEHEIKLLL